MSLLQIHKDASMHITYIMYNVFAYTHIMNPVIPPPLAHHLEVVVEVHPDSFKQQIFTDLHRSSQSFTASPDFHWNKKLRPQACWPVAAATALAMSAVSNCCRKSSEPAQKHWTKTSKAHSEFNSHLVKEQRLSSKCAYVHPAKAKLQVSVAQKHCTTEKLLTKGYSRIRGEMPLSVRPNLVSCLKAVCKSSSHMQNLVARLSNPRKKPRKTEKHRHHENIKHNHAGLYWILVGYGWPTETPNVKYQVWPTFIASELVIIFEASGFGYVSLRVARVTACQKIVKLSTALEATK